jgi:hypothetical protein
MSAPDRSSSKTTGIIFYGIVTGFATTVAIVLGSFFLIFLATWVFRYRGAPNAGELAAGSGLGSVYFTFIPGLIAGVIVCVKVCAGRLSETARAGAKE